MSEIGPIGGGASASGVSRPHVEGAGRPGENAEPRSARRGADRVDVSSLAKSLSRLNQEQPVRQDLIDRVRAEIEAGRYDTPERVDAAVTNLLRKIDPNA
jgi:anti-sigma28 factor (negative regulator of flagellin synthesis)